MTEAEGLIVALAVLIGWIGWLHWRVHALEDGQAVTATSLRGLTDQVNRLHREVRTK